MYNLRLAVTHIQIKHKKNIDMHNNVNIFNYFIMLTYNKR